MIIFAIICTFVRYSRNMAIILKIFHIISLLYFQVLESLVGMFCCFAFYRIAVKLFIILFKFPMCIMGESKI